MSILDKCAFLEIWLFFQSLLPRPNHYAHDVRSEILSRTPVSILLYLSPRPQNLRKPLIIVPLPECQPEFPSDGDDGSGIPTTLDIWRSPGPTCPGTKYPVRGIPHFDNIEVRDSRTGYLVPGHGGPGLRQMSRVVGKPPPSSHPSWGGCRAPRPSL